MYCEYFSLGPKIPASDPLTLPIYHRSQHCSLYCIYLFIKFCWEIFAKMIIRKKISLWGGTLPYRPPEPLSALDGTLYHWVVFLLKQYVAFLLKLVAKHFLKSKSLLVPRRRQTERAFQPSDLSNRACPHFSSRHRSFSLSTINNEIERFYRDCRKGFHGFGCKDMLIFSDWN